MEELSAFKIGVENVAYSKYFVGKSYLNYVSKDQITIYNVTFEPRCRNDWHIHNAKSGGGQILIVVSGVGYYQEEGKQVQILKPGDCINIKAGVKHWHGATPNSWFQHLAIEVPGVELSTEWLEKVDDEYYDNLEK